MIINPQPFNTMSRAAQACPGKVTNLGLKLNARIKGGERVDFDLG
jgi:hypothetical protein